MAPKLTDAKQATVVEYGTRIMEIICELENHTGLEVIGAEIVHHSDGVHRGLMLQIINPMGTVQ